MALCEVKFFSAALGTPVVMNVLVPDSGRGPFPTLYLLHGLLDNHESWLKWTRLAWYVRDMPLVVVLPEGGRGFYTDHEHGPKFGTYITDDVISTVQRLFPVKTTRAGRCVGGLSMGGYGAIRLALANPSLFVSANSHSGALLRGTRSWRDGEPEFMRVFGEHPAGSDHDLLHLAHRSRHSGKLPKMFIDCGTSDFLLQDNRDFHAALLQMGIPHEYREYDGDHNWDYWDYHIQESLAFHAHFLKL